jgi:hypothetical protein
MRISILAYAASLGLSKQPSAPQAEDWRNQVSSSVEPSNDHEIHRLSTKHPLRHWHLRQIANHPNSTNCTQQAKRDADYLPSGYYDALGNPISEKEYFHQVDYERKHGIPYARDREREKADTKKPLSLLAHPEISCNGDVVARIIESGICYRDVQGSSIFMNSLPSDCEVISSKDESCEQDPFDMIPVLSQASGCYTTDAFSSIRVDCRPLPI